MKSTTKIALEYITEETIDDYASIRSEFFGEIILEAMGIRAACTAFCKCKTGGYNIGWMTRDGNEFLQTFSFQEITKAFDNKVLSITTEVTRKNTE